MHQGISALEGSRSCEARFGISSREQGVGSGGFALFTTILMLGIFGALTAAMLSGAISVIGSTRSDVQAAKTFYAAEAGAEAALAQLEELLKDGSLNEADLATIEPPVFDGFDFDGFSVELTGSAQVETLTDGPYAGLYALTQFVRIYAPATDKTNSISAIELSAKAQAIPLFQFGVFFDGDLEATNGPPMEFEGRVHSNANIYLSSDNAWYRQPITTPQKVFHRRKDQDDVKNGVFIDDDTGTEVALDFDSESVPGFEAFKMRSCDQFDCRLKTEAFGVEPLELPIPEGVPPYELLLPRQDSDTDGEREVKFAWNADMYVTVDLNDVKNQGAVCDDEDDDDDDDDGKRLPNITIERPLGGAVPNKPTKCKIFVWDWEAFVDSREKKPVDALDIDINELKNWVTDDPVDNETRLIYVEIIPLSGSVIDPAKTDPTGDEYYPVVRIMKGSELHGPLTISTEHPLYHWGDYNTVNKQPAAVAGDAYHVLSDAWDDSEHQIIREQGGAGLTTASPTSINVAILAGHWATPCDWVDAGCPGGYEDFYGGGIENYPRFLESWRDGSDKVIFEYRGALISPFTSEKATGTWNGKYYKPPQRDWSFDSDFLDPNLLPPGTPNVGIILRTAFREAY